MNNVFSKNITYVEYARSGVEFYTENIEEVKQLIDAGWKCNQYTDGFRVIPPEECIVDITNYQKAMQYGNPIFNLAYYDFLIDLIENNTINYFINRIIEGDIIYYRNFDFLVSYGPILDTEIRISGSDSRIKKLKIDMAQEFINSKNYKAYIKNASMLIKSPRELCTYKQKLCEKDEREQKFYKEIEENIKIIKNIKVYNPNIFKIYNLDKIQDIDVILFIPFGCFKYLSSFTNSKNLGKIMFWEFHIEETKPSTFKLFEKNLKNKKILIIDNMYSGKTMNLAKEKVKEQGGVPIILGINPKNKNNILNSDYSMILNTIFKNNELDVKDKDFFRNIYIEIFKDKNI